MFGLFIAVISLAGAPGVQNAGPAVAEDGLSWSGACGISGATEDEMVGRHHRLAGRECEQAPGVGDRQGNLACCSPRGCKKSAQLSV